MKVPGIVENGVVRPLYAIKLPEGKEVEIVLPEVEIDEREIERRKKWWAEHQKLEPIDIRPLTTTQLVREDRDSH